jgi:ribosomal protein L35
MIEILRRFLAIVLCGLLIELPLQAELRPAPKLPPAVQEAFEEALATHYWDLFDEAAGYELRSSQIERMRAYLDEAEKGCVKRFKQRAKTLGEQRSAAQHELRKRTGDATEEQRHEMHCRVQNLSVLEEQASIFAKHAVPLAYDHYQA